MCGDQAKRAGLWLIALDNAAQEFGIHVDDTGRLTDLWAKTGELDLLPVAITHRDGEYRLRTTP